MMPKMIHGASCLEETTFILVFLIVIAVMLACFLSLLGEGKPGEAG